MRKIAVFVEGKTELIIIRELLVRAYNWTIDLSCYQLVGDDIRTAEYQHSCMHATVHYDLFVVGNDRKVLSVLLSRANNMLDKGFERIIAARDMYSKEYKNVKSSIDWVLIQNMRELAQQKINDCVKYPEKIFFNFAIMETEAWILGIENLLQSIDSRLTYQFIKDRTGYDLLNIDPENTFFSPAEVLSEIYNEVGLSYDKHTGTIEALARNASFEDYKILYKASKCASFNSLFDSLLSNISIDAA